MDREATELTPPGDARLRALLLNLLKVLGGLVVLFVIVYAFGQRTASVPVTPQADVNVTNAEAAVRTNPNDIGARVLLADAYLRAGRGDEALDQLNEILRTDPKNRAALMGVATILYDRGDVDGAKQRLDAFVAASGSGEFASQDTQLEQAYYLLGEIAQQRDENTSAVAYFRKALQINGGDADAWFKLGTVLNDLKQYKDAAASFTQALAFVPEGWCEPYDGLATAYQGQANDAGAAFASSMAKVCGGGGLRDAKPLATLTKGPFQIPALLGLGLAAEHDQALSDALGYYQQVTAVDKTNVAAVSAIARIKANAPTPAT